MTKKEKAIVELYTGVCMLTGNDRDCIYSLAEKVMGRPVYTHELYSEEVKEKIKPLFIELCKK